MRIEIKFKSGRVSVYDGVEATLSQIIGHMTPDTRFILFNGSKEAVQIAEIESMREV